MMYYVEIWNQMANPFPRYKLQIFAHSALSTGVEDDVIEEDTTGDKSGIIREVVCILCVKGSAEYLLVWSLKVANLRTFSFVNMCGEWYYRGGWRIEPPR